MELLAYLTERGLSQREFGKLIGVSSGTVSNYVLKKRRPTLKIAKKIEEVTRRKVRMEDLL